MNRINLNQKIALATAGVTLGLGIINSSPAQAITFVFDWTGQIAGFRVAGLFSYDETQSYPNGIVSTSDLDSLSVSFFGPSGTLLRTYATNHLDPGVNFNFDTQTKQLLQAGSFNAPDGINIGAPNYDQQSGNDPSQASGLSFWSKPPRSNTPHLHVDDWDNAFGISLGFPPHEEIAFPTRTTQQLIDSGRVGPAYLPPNGQPVTALNEMGQFAQVAQVPEPSALLGLGVLGLASLMRHRKK